MNCRETDHYTQGQECFVRIIPAPVIYPSVLSRFLPPFARLSNRTQNKRIQYIAPLPERLYNKHDRFHPYRRRGRLYKRSMKSESQKRKVQRMKIQFNRQKPAAPGPARLRSLRPRLAAAVILLALSAGLMALAAARPQFAEWYAENIYPVFVDTAGRLWGIFPFSVSELTLYILIAAFVLSTAVMVSKTVKGAKEKKAVRRHSTDTAVSSGAARAAAQSTEQTAVQGTEQTAVQNAAQAAASWLSCILLAAGILAFLYTICCGINYHRRSFSEEEGIVTYRYTAQELKDVCLWLTEEVNALSGEVDRDSSGVMTLEAPEGEGAVEAMRDLAEEFPALEGYYPQPKKLLVSEILSYQGLTGIYSPFTVEANYNGDMTAYNIPFTTCHELSHLRGFMQEEEANFIAFLACIGSERTDFQYSGYLSGWVYCMNALYRADHESWQEVRPLLAEEAGPDLEANSAFWDEYEGRISETADKINDTYLKVNGQADGVRSYSRMVDLIVAYKNL